MVLFSLDISSKTLKQFRSFSLWIFMRQIDPHTAILTFIYEILGVEDAAKPSANHNTTNLKIIVFITTNI